MEAVSCESLILYWFFWIMLCSISACLTEQEDKLTNYLTSLERYCGKVKAEAEHPELYRQSDLELKFHVIRFIYIVILFILGIALYFIVCVDC